MAHPRAQTSSARILATIAALVLIGVVLIPSASALHVNSSAVLGPSQTGDSDGTGTIALTLDANSGEVCYTLTVANIDPPTAAHIHSGVAGSTGGVVVNFGAPVVLGAMTCVTASSADVQAIVDDPASFYVNVHNAAFPAGAIRGQIDSVAAGTIQSSTTAMTGTGEPAASGSIAMGFDTATGEICFTLTTDLTSTINAAHIHTGGPGVNGGIVIGLTGASNDTTEKCFVASTSDIATVLGDPNGHYVNVHTDVAPAGAIRGQVAPTSPSSFTAHVTLDGLGFGDPDGSGSVQLTLFPDGAVCFDLTVADIEEPTAGHVHAGADGVQGGVVVDLDLPANGLMGCVQSTPANVQAISADPAGHYVNVHNAAFPAGAIRGQLTPTTPAPSTTTFDLILAATGDPDGSGSAQLDIDPATGRVCFSIVTMDIGAVTAAHVHVGGIGVNGGVLIDLDTPVNALAGCVFVSASDATAVVNDPAGHYLNVHTAEAPAGAIRAQLDGAEAPVPTPDPAATPTTGPVPGPAPTGPGPITNVPPGVAPARPLTPVAPAVQTDPAAPTSTGTAELAFTGAETPLFAMSAVAMIGLGLVAVGASRRSRAKALSAS